MTSTPEFDDGDSDDGEEDIAVQPFQEWHPYLQYLLAEGDGDRLAKAYVFYQLCDQVGAKELLPLCKDVYAWMHSGKDQTPKLKVVKSESPPKSISGPQETPPSTVS